MLHTIKKVRYLNGYKLALIFNDGATKIIDFEYRLKNAKNMFVPLKNIEYFKKVRADGTTIVWPNGLDLCPDVLYELSENMPQQKTKAAWEKHKPSSKKSKRSTSKSKS